MDKGKENPLTLQVENAQLAHHLRTAATRYYNCAQFISRLRNIDDLQRARIKKYKAAQLEAETWANMIDPEGQADYEETRDRWSQNRYQGYGPPR